MEKTKVEKRIIWIQDILKTAGVDRIVLGVSGGIDSAVSLNLAVGAVGPNNVYAILMPCESKTCDVEYAKMECNRLGLPRRNIIVADLTTVFEKFYKNLRDSTGYDIMWRKLAIANIKPRLRMTTIYAYAAQFGGLVCGTENKTENFVGYMTKWGDQCSDFEPIGDLTKTEVRLLADYFEVYSPIRERPPSACLWGTQTDEDELGMTYDDMDKFIETGEGTDKTKNKMMKLFDNAEHKRNPAPIFGE